MTLLEVLDLKTGIGIQEVREVLAIHESERVRGALHRSFTQLGGHTLVLAASIEIGQETVSRARPPVVVLRLTPANLEWATELVASSVALVFCFTRGDDMRLASRARKLGVTSFVELPGDLPSHWATNVERLSQGIHSATASRRVRQSSFARVTAVQPAICIDLARSIKPGHSEESISNRSTQRIDVIELAEKRAESGRRSTVLPAISAEMIAGAVTQPRSTAVAVIAIGASTGGSDALAEILPRMPVDSPCVVIVQHMAAGQQEALIKRLGKLCAIEVRLAQEGDTLRPGLALIAPPNHHLSVVVAATGLLAHLTSDPPIDEQRPSVNTLFRSVARLGASAIGVILSGANSDGAVGMTVMRRAGAITLAQDKESSVAFDMPLAAISTGGASEVLALADVAETLCRHCKVTALPAPARPSAKRPKRTRKRASKRSEQADKSSKATA